MTDNVELSDGEKTIMNADEPIYGDLITEIELVDDPATNDKVKESLTDLVDQQTNESPIESTEIPTETETFVAADVLTQDDDAVSEFFTVDTKTDDFDNDMLIGELDNEGIDFKNETDIAECHHEYESKKLLFGDCEDIVEVVNTEVEQEEVLPLEEISPETPQEAEKHVIDPEIDKSEPNSEDIDPCFEIVAAAEESLNRMHVMEDVGHGCEVPKTLPSSPGHAEQCPESSKISTEVAISMEETIVKESVETTIVSEDQISPAQNGLLENSPASHITINETEEEKLPKNSEVAENSRKKSEQVEQESIKQKAESTQQEVIEKTEREENDTVEENKSISPPQESVKESQDVKRDDEYDNTSSSDSFQSTHSSKRKADGDDSSLSPAKRLRAQIQHHYVNHERILNDYIEALNCGTVDEVHIHAENLLAEIRTLNELAKEKEKEWNNIIHVKKVKEELLLRMQRKKHVLLMNNSIGDKDDPDWNILEQIEDQSNTKNNITKQSATGGNSNLMMVPIISSSPAGNVTLKSSKQDRSYTKSRNSLPKNVPNVDLNGQGENKQGRQGPILDVRSIIADYRQRHPETVPRRGRRLKSVLNTVNNDNGGKITASGNVLSMTSLTLGSGSQVRHAAGDMSNELGLLLSTMEQVRGDSSRFSNADSSSTSLLTGNSDAAMSFKDVLVQFARLSQSERQELQAQAAASLTAAAVTKPPPPPYPEVTLHPVPTAQTNQVQVSTSQNSSLLHGILTKTQPRTDAKPTTFSPTLARLLTAPERANNTAQAMYNAALNSGVSISDLLSTGKDEEEAEDNADRLVIDEGNEMSSIDRNRTDNGSESDDVPQCQGCHQKSAQFVCAGCGNQWYCSRDCQVAAWDEHSEVCSG